jgi:DNA-binding PadR family transcriptional regulator
MNIDQQSQSPDALPEASILILIAIARRPMHGYLIMQTVNTYFASPGRLGPGTLYRTLQRLRLSKLIEEGDSDGDGDERRVNYRITPAGRTAIRLELKRLKSLLAFADDKEMSP